MTVEFKIKCVYELCQHHRGLETGRGKSSFQIKGVITPDSRHIQQNYSSTLTTQVRQWINLQHNLIWMTNSHWHKNHILDRLSSCVECIYKKEDHIFCHIFFILFFSSLKEMFCRGESRRLDFINLRLTFADCAAHSCRWRTSKSTFYPVSMDVL